MTQYRSKQLLMAADVKTVFSAPLTAEQAIALVERLDLPACDELVALVRQIRESPAAHSDTARRY